MLNFSASQQAAIDRDNRSMNTAGIPMSQVLDDIGRAIDSGAIGITASGAEVDAVAKGGEAFAQDADTTTGLTFGYSGGRFHNGYTVVAVAAGTLALSPSATNYLEVDRAGTVSANTSGFTPGSLPLYQVVTGASTIATVTNKKPIYTLIGPAGVTGTLLSTPGSTKEVLVNLGDVSDTATFTIIAPGNAGTLAKVALATKTAITADDSDYWSFALVNKGPSGGGTTNMFNTGDANTTKATGGSGLTGYVKRDLTLHGTTGNLAVAAGDVLELTITKTGSATTMEQCALRIDFTFTA